MRPLSRLALFVTENCNLRCEYCFAHNREPAMIDPALAHRALDFFLDQAKGATPLALSFWGGEPLMNFSLIKELVMAARKKAGSRQISFSLPTNVTLLDREKLDFFTANGVALSLSLDGLAPSQNQRSLASGKPSFPLVLKALELIHEYYGKNLPAVRKTVTPVNVQALEADTNFFLDQGFRYLALSPDMEASWDSASLKAYDSAQNWLGQRWLESLEAGDPFYIRSWIDLWMLEELSGKEGLALNSFVCGAGSSMAAVDIQGRLFPCHRMVFSQRESGTYQIGTIDQGWDQSARQAYVEVKPKHAQNCGACGLEKICSFLCPATNGALSGSIYKTAKPACDFYAMTGSFLTQLDKEALRSQSYREFKAGLKQKSPWQGDHSAYSRFFLTSPDFNARKNMENRAMAILDSLRQQKEKP